MRADPGDLDRDRLDLLGLELAEQLRRLSSGRLISRTAALRICRDLPCRGLQWGGGHTSSRLGAIDRTRHGALGGSRGVYPRG